MNRSDHKPMLAPAQPGECCTPGRRIALGSVATWALLSMAGWSTILGTAMML